MKEYHINIGEYCVCKTPAKIICRGLGPCVGLFLYDRLNKIGAGAHIMLPDDLPTEKIKTKIAKYAFQEMIMGLILLGANTRHLNARIVGGASIYQKDSIKIGARNVEAVKKLLLLNGIYLSQEEVGGNVGRSAVFNLDHGILNITSVKMVI